ncbi:hypothetical protein D3C84_933340 [compost metagenome]
MSQGAPIVVARRLALTQTDAPRIGRDQRLQTLTRRLGEGFRRTPVARPLWCIQADQAHAAAIGQAQGVTVHHPLDLGLRQLAWRRAQRPYRDKQEDGNEKGAH